MDRNEILANYEDFKKCYMSYEKKNKDMINFDDFNVSFGVKSFFIDTKSFFVEDMFFEKIVDIVVFSLKHQLHELEYFVNIKPANTIMSLDYEVLKDDKKLLKLYYKNHKHYKKYMIMLLENKENSKQVLNFLKESYEIIKENVETLIPVNKKLIDNIDEKMKKIEQKKAPVFESSVFN